MSTLDITLPVSNTGATLREMTGLDEDILASKDKRLTSAERMSRLLASTMTSLGGRKPTRQDIDGLTTIDRIFAVLELRRLSVGDVFKMAITCPLTKRGRRLAEDPDYVAATEEAFRAAPAGQEPARAVLAALDAEHLCRHVGKWDLNLASDLHHQPPGVAAAIACDIGDGIIATVSPMCGADEISVPALEANPDVTALTATLLLLVRDLVTPKGAVQFLRPIHEGPNLIAARRALDALTLRQRNALRDHAERHVAAFANVLDLKVDIDCPACGGKFDAQLDLGDRGFFFPSGT